MSFVLGRGSLKELEGVHPKLVSVVKKAIKYTTVDFTVHSGLRTLEEQKKLVAKGTSKTLNSKHRVQSDGFGHAVDLVPYVNGKLLWEWDYIWPIAIAMDKAATEDNVKLIWGAVWDRNLMQYGGNIAQLKQEVEAYKARRRPNPAFLDGPHYQIQL